MKRENISPEIESVTMVKKARKEDENLRLNHKEDESFSKASEKHLSSNENPPRRSHEEINNILSNSPANQMFCKNIADLVSKVKQETTENDIQIYAQHAMNELLGLYGYEKVAASDIGKIHQHRSDNDSAKELRCREATKSTSPISLQSNPSQSLLSHSDEEDATCSWCSKPCHAAFSLQEGECTKNFCSEKCFAACRRANFKRNKGNLNPKSDDESTVFSNMKFFKASVERNKELQKDSSKPSLYEKLCYNENLQDKQEHQALNKNKSKFGLHKKKDKPQKPYDIRRPGVALRSSLSQKSHSSKEASFHKNVFPTKHRFGKENANSNKISAENFPRQEQEPLTEFDVIKPSRKISSEFKNQPSENDMQNGSDSPITGNILQQYPFLGLYPPPTLPFLGINNLTNSLIGNVKFDADSFRLGLLTALQQNKTVEQISRPFIGNCSCSPDSSLDHNATPSQITSKKDTPHLPQKSYLKSSLSESNFLSKSTQSFAQNPQPLSSEIKSIKNANLPHPFPSPMLMIPFPIPIPIPIPIPVSQNEFSCPTSTTKSEATSPKSAAFNCTKNEQGYAENPELKSQNPNFNSQAVSYSETDHGAMMENREKPKTVTGTNSAIDLSMKTQNSSTSKEKQMGNEQN